MFTDFLQEVITYYDVAFSDQQIDRQILCVYLLFSLVHLHLYSESELVPLLQFVSLTSYFY